MTEKLTLESMVRSPRLPSLPAVALRAIDLARNPEVTIGDLASLIETDQGLAVRVLRVVNSSFFGLTSPCGSIHRAIGLLGLKAVRSLALSFSLVDSIDGGKNESDIAFDYLTYWRRAIYSAVAANRIATRTGACNAEEALVCALLQDIGMVALYRTLGEQYLQIIDICGEDHSGLPRVEERVLGFDHAQAGAAVAEHWRLPPHLVESIRHHHNPAEAPRAQASLVKTVHTATLAASALSSRRPGSAIAAVRGAMQEWFGIDAPGCGGILEDVSRSATELAHLLDLQTGAPADIDAILNEAEDLRLRIGMGEAQNSAAARSSARAA